MTVTQLQTRPKPEMLKKEDELFDLIILGGGPAGLTSALYAKRAKLKVLLVEKMILGGAATTTFLIENYPGFPEGLSGMELSNRLQDQVRRLGLDILWGNASKIVIKKTHKEVITNSKTLKTKAIIVATGTESAKLGIEGEKEFLGRGVSYCATCDGAFYKGKNIMVVGGGNSAIEEAIFLTRFAKKISIVHRRDQLRADKILADQAASHPKIYFFWHSTLEKILGVDKVNEVLLKDLQTNKNLKVPVDGVFIYIGSIPHSDIVKGIVKLDKKGFIITNEEMKTSVKGIFAAGDVRVKQLRQVITAVSDGAIAAESARKYIEGEHA